MLRSYHYRVGTYSMNFFGRSLVRVSNQNLDGMDIAMAVVPAVLKGLAITR